MPFKRNPLFVWWLLRNPKPPPPPPSHSHPRHLAPFQLLLASANETEQNQIESQERDAATEKVASTAALLETSEKNLADAEARSRSIEEAVGGEEQAAAAALRDAEGRAAASAEALAVLEQEGSGLREEV